VGAVAKKVDWLIDKLAPGAFSLVPPNVKSEDLFLKFTSGNSDGTRIGTGDDPVLVNMADQDNRRALYTLGALVTKADGTMAAIRKTTLRVALERSIVAQVPGVRNPITTAELNVTFSNFSAGQEPAVNALLPGKYLPMEPGTPSQTLVKAFFDDYFGTSDIDKGKRLVRVVSNPKNADLIGRFSAATLALPILMENATQTGFNYVHSGVMGVGVHPFTPILTDFPDFKVVIEHEANHVKHHLASDFEGGAGSTPEGQLLRSIILNIANQYYTPAVPANGRTEDARIAISFAAAGVAGDVDELLVGFKDLTNSEGGSNNASWYMANHLLDYFSDNWNRVLALLEPGATRTVKAKNQNGAEFTFTVSLGGLARIEVLGKMRNMYDNLPGFFKDVQGGTLDLPGGVVTYTSIVSPHLLKPQD